MKNRIVLLSSVCAVLLSCLTPASAAPGYFRQPSIHSQNIVFVAEGDLWRTSVSGGVAQRLTTHPAAETLPSISPDGAQVAFTARYEGPAEVYVMPIAGGPPTRLTYDGDVALVQGWTRDGRVLFSTTRYSGRPEERLFAIDPATRAVKAIPLAEAAEGCYIGTTLFFARRSALGDNVKGYQGGLVQQIWRFSESEGANKEAVLLTGSHKGTSRQPMCAADRVYFLSDRDGSMNIWSMNAAGQDLKQHTRHEIFDIRGAAISADGQRIVYQRGADLQVLNIATQADTRLDISLQSDFEHLRTRWVKTPWDFVTDWAPSPTGDRVAITARGQVFVAPVGPGRRVEATRMSEVRARGAVFSYDGKNVLAFADKTGEMELTRYPANGVGEGTVLTKNASVLRLRAFPSPDGKWVAHHDKDRRLYLLNLATGEDREIARNRYDQFDEIVWSPDSRWLVIEKAAANYFETLQLMEVATGKTTSLTSDRYHARSATFSPDGKWLYFLGDRHLQSLVGSPWGQRNPEPFFDRQSRIYALALDANARWPFLAKDELQKPEPEKKPDTDKKPEPPKKTEPDKKPEPAKPFPAKPAPEGGDVEPVDKSKAGGAKDEPKSAAATAKPPASAPVAIKLEGLTERLYEVPVPPGNYSRLSTDGKRLYFIVTETSSERKQSLRSVAIEAPNPGAPVVDLFFDEIRSYQMTQDRKKLLIRKANDLWVFDAGKSAPPPPEQAKFAVNLRDWTFAVDPREEWKQMFVDAWRMHRDYFYDKNLHGVDWKAMRARYQPLVDRVTDRGELNDVIAQMIAQLSILHSQVGAADVRKGEDAIDVAALAADAIKTDSGFRVTRLYNGDTELLEERGPLAKPEVNVRIGETIVSVNGIPAKSVASLGELLRNQVGKQVLMTVADNAGKRRDVIVTPITARRDRDLRYLAWEQERRAKVDEAGKQRIGYVHLQAMGGGDIARWAREFYPVFQREGLILDLRHNRGGSIDSWIIEKLQRRAWQFWKARDLEDPISNQQLAFRGHVVALIDAETYSDGETMAQGLKRLGIAPLIGVTTAGAGIWLSDQNRLRDNGIARAAELGSFVDDGKERAWITEGTGVAPDMEVDNPPHATFNGADAQLDAAIRYLQEKMAKEPMREPKAPAYPVLKRK
jgi:tricorn protease